MRGKAQGVFLHTATDDGNAVTMGYNRITTILPEMFENADDLWDVSKHYTSDVGGPHPTGPKLLARCAIPVYSHGRPRLPGARGRDV